MKKRSCRRSREEKAIHDQAIRIRKMTDEQLVKHIAQEKKSNYDAGYRDGIMKGREGDEGSIASFLDEIETIKGIGTVTVVKLRKVAKANGYI